MRKNIIIIIFIIIINFIGFLPSVFAQDASPSADFKSKLKALQEEIASKAADFKTEVSKKLLNKVYIGFIKTLSDSSITINNPSGFQNITINEYTEYTSKGSKIAFKNLAENSFIIALGDSDEKGVLTAKKVIKTSSSSAILEQAFYGEVTAIKPDITINTKQGTKLTVKTAQNTTFQLGKNEVDFKKVMVGKPIIAVGELTGQDLTARFIYIYPYALLPTPATSTNSASSSGKFN